MTNTNVTNGHFDTVANTAINDVDKELYKTEQEEKAWLLLKVFYSLAKISGLYVAGIVEFRDGEGNMYNSKQLKDKFGYKAK